MLSPRGNVIRLLRHAVRVRYGSQATEPSGRQRDPDVRCTSNSDQTGKCRVGPEGDMGSGRC